MKVNMIRAAQRITCTSLSLLTEVGNAFELGLLHSRKSTSTLNRNGAMLMFCVLFILAVGDMRSAAQGVWKTSSPMPTARADLAAVTGPDGRIYAINGRTQNGAGGTGYTLVEIFDPSKGTWETGNPPADAHDQGRATVGKDGRIYLIGGYYRDTYSEAYDPATQLWTPLSPMPTGRFGFALVSASDGIIYAIGGDTGGGGEPVAIVEAYDPKTNTWATRHPMSVARLGLGAAVGSNGRIYAIGGVGGTDSSGNRIELPLAEEYNPANDSWSTAAPMPTARWNLSVVSGPDGGIYAIGGQTLTNVLNTVELFDPGVNAWYAVAPMPTARCCFGTTTGLDGRIWCLGGFGVGQSPNIGADIVEVFTPPKCVAHAQLVSVAHNAAESITLKGSDEDTPPRPLTFAISSPPKHGKLGTLNAVTGVVLYTPTSNFQGADTFTFAVNNGKGSSVPAAVTLHVAPGIPTAASQTLSVVRGRPISITLSGADPDIPALALRFAVATSTSHGILGHLNPGTGVIVYTPDTDFQGTDSFSFIDSNGTNVSSPATVTLNVAPGVPTAKKQTNVVKHNTAASISLTGSDPDLPALPLTYALGSAPASGTVTGFNASTGAVTYTPNSSFQGTDGLTFTVSNGTDISASATVTLHVTAGTPTANAQNESIAHESATTLTLTGSDPDVPALPLRFAISSNPSHGVLGHLNTRTGVLVYTPIANYQGSDSFTFMVTNGTNTSASATVTLTVAPGIPHANPQTDAVTPNTAKVITLSGTDPDVPALPLMYAISVQPQHGKLINLNASTGAVTYAPNTGFTGTDTFSFAVSNGANTSAAAVVTLKVGG